MFHWVDWVLLFIVAVSAGISLKRGFFKEAFSLLVIVIAVVISIMFHEQLAILLSPYIDSPSLRKLAGFGGLLIICMVMGGLINMLLSQLIHITGLTGTDRFLGMIFGALRGVVVIVVLLMIGKTMLPLNHEQWWLQSQLIPHFLMLESWIVSAAYYLRDLIVPLFQ